MARIGLQTDRCNFVPYQSCPGLNERHESLQRSGSGPLLAQNSTGREAQSTARPLPREAFPVRMGEVDTERDERSE